jgi:uncharacterized cupredoxin-like copper-binding protein
MMLKTFLAAAALVAGLSGIAHGHGDEHETVYGIVMREQDGKMVFIPDKLRVRKGEQIRFQLRNNGEVDHEFVVGTVEENLKHMKEMEKNPDMEHDDPNAKRLKPKTTAELIWQFTKAGTFDFSCLIPGHRPAGMFGTIVVD